MRKKCLCTVVTFPTTTAAMAAEAFLRARQREGRLIPVPTQITASCGLAWSAPAGMKQQFTNDLREQKIPFEQIVELVI